MESQLRFRVCLWPRGRDAKSTPLWPHLTLVTSAKSLFPNKMSHSQVPGVRIQHYLFGDTIQPITGGERVFPALMLSYDNAHRGKDNELLSSEEDVCV